MPIKEKDYVITTVTLPKKLISVMETLKNNGVVPSNSWIVKECIIGYLPKIVKDWETATRLIEEKDVTNLKKFMENRGFKVVKKTGSTPLRRQKIEGNPYYDKAYDEIGNEIFIPKESVVNG